MLNHFSSKIGSRILMVLCMAMGIISPGIAAEFVAMENEALHDVTARDPEGHWTANRLLNAEPLPVPRPSMSLPSMLSQVPQADALSEPKGASVSVDGQNIPQSEEVEPDLNDRLFPELNMEVMRDSVKNSQITMNSLENSSAIFAGEASGEAGTIPFDVGSLGAYFTSSQLIPTTARVHYPYRTVGKLFFEIPGQGNFICSAAVLRPRIILTAGHCVHKGSGGANGFYQKFLFVPAYHNGSAPYQAWNWRWVITTGEWASSNGSVPNKADFAIIELEDRKFGSDIKKIGEVTGWLGYRTNALLPNHTKKLGYPANHDSGQIMHHVDSQHFQNGGENTVLYGSDMRGGSSGGPWVENFGIKAVGQDGGLKPWPNRAIGVTSYGYVAVGPLVQGSSILNQSFLNILNTACAHRSGNC